ncbi:MAG: hypothetical protein JWL84_915 [Rhodospirillales bacterium]|jgi:hypothetical protein|nr:hypothetical protein [Rhodospirillales bacterium]
MASILDREHIVAGPGFSRWLVPPADTITRYIMAVLLVIGFICNYLMPVDARHYIKLQPAGAR